MDRASRWPVGSSAPTAWLILSLILWLGVAGCRVGSGPQPAEPRSASSAASSVGDALAIDGPASAPAGQPLRIVVRGEGAPLLDGDLVRLIGHGGYGVRVWQAEAVDGRAVFALDGGETQRAGVWTLRARAERRQGKMSLLLKPGSPAAPLVPLVGARSIQADAASWAMVVAVPQDKRGNPVESGTEVELTIARPDGRREEGRAPVAFGIVWWRIYSGTRAGLTRIALRSGAAHGPEGELREVAGWPLPPRLSIDPPTLPADGRSLTTLRSAPLADRFGNRLPDGTRVTFALRGPGALRSLLPAIAVDGIAEALLEAPQLPGRMSVRAAVHDVLGPQASITFGAGPAVGRFPMWIENDGDGRRLVAGPLLGELGQEAPEGTMVRVTLRGPGGHEIVLDMASAGGWATVLLPESLPPGPWTVTASAGTATGATSFRVTEP